MPGDTDYNDYQVPPQVGASAVTTSLPQSTHQETTTNLANGASIDFDFNIDFNNVFDAFVFADVALTLRVFVRQSGSDSYRQLGQDYDIEANAVNNVLKALRVPGSQARVRILNNSGGVSGVLSAQVHSRSF